MQSSHYFLYASVIVIALAVGISLGKQMNSAEINEDDITKTS